MQHALSLVRGTCKEFDHGCITHALWKRFVELGMSVFVRRVPTEVNIADDPSREDYWLADNLPAREVAGLLDECFHKPSAWAMLSVRDILVDRSTSE